MKRVLIIGNGFDIAHGLPTRYIDFLYSCACIMNRKLDYDDVNKEIVNTKVIEKFRSSFESAEIDEMRKNSWIKYFIDRANKIGKNWIDFEEEIKQVCVQSSKGISDAYIEMITQQLRFSFFLDDNHKFKKDLMYSDFTNLKCYIKKYIKVINELPINTYSKDILDFSPDVVLSYNYSNTFMRVYYEINDYRYFHGSSNNKIVLGIDNIDNYEYNRLTKTMQRMNYGLSIDIDNLVYGDYELMFYGLSFGYSDNDTIKKMIEKSTKVYITYYSDEDKENKLLNLARYYELGDLEYLYTHKLNFVQQGVLKEATYKELNERRIILERIEKRNIDEKNLNETLNYVNKTYIGGLNLAKLLLSINKINKECESCLSHIITLYDETPENIFFDSDLKSNKKINFNHKKYTLMKYNKNVK